MKGELVKFPRFYNNETLVKRMFPKVKNSTVFYFMDLILTT